jgi:membrane associated rhomboid family serine protease
MAYNQNMGGLGKFNLFPPVIKGLLIANVAVFFLQYMIFDMLRVGDVSLAQFFFKYFALFPLTEGFWPWQLVSYQFMHGGFSHIFFNLFALWMFGAELENLWGSKKFLVFYLLGGIGAGLTQLLISPVLSQVGPTVGASGSVYGILLAFALTYPNRSIFIFPFFIPIKAKYLILLLVGADLLMGLTSSSSTVAHFAHLGGAATGYLLLKFGDQTGVFNILNFLYSDKDGSSRKYSKQAANVYKVNWQNTKQSYYNEDDDAYKVDDTRPSSNSSEFWVDGENITQNKIDEILDKISESGYQNLTEREKKILFELSQKL